MALQTPTLGPLERKDWHANKVHNCHLPAQFCDVRGPRIDTL